MSTHHKVCKKRELSEYKDSLDTLLSQSKSFSDRLLELENDFVTVKQERDVFKNSYYMLLESFIKYKKGESPEIETHDLITSTCKAADT
tara:strand:+ start:585 stop:851 length:267 start_codon:yes stop_codon:yes gene_type:complete